MPGSVKDEIKIFAGSSNGSLAAAISDAIGVPLGRAEIGRFSDGEVQVEITENVRGGDVFVIQSTCAPTNDHLMELLLMLDAFKRASARRITAVIPYYGYARQDRKVSPRVPISAKLVADLITTAGAIARPDRRPPRRADPGLLQHPRRQRVRHTRPAPVPARAHRRAGADRGLPGRGRRRAGACIRQTPRCQPRDHRQATGARRTRSPRCRSSARWTGGWP